MFSGPALLIDIILVIALILAVWRGAKKGFVLTLCGLVAVLVAFIGANIVADAMAPKVAESIQPKLQQVIEEQLNEALKNTEFTGVSGDVATSADDVSLSGVLQVLRENELYIHFMDGVEKALEEGAAATAASAAAQVAATLAAQLARGILFVAAFFIILLLWTVLSHALDLVTKLPGLNTLNGALGGAIGFVKGLIILYLVVWILYDLTGYISPATAQQTFLFRFLLEHGPLDLLRFV